MQENIDKIENVIRIYNNGKFTVIVSHNPEGKSFREGLKDYFQKILDKEFGE